MMKPLAILLALSCAAIVKADIYTVLFRYAYAEGEDRGCNAAAISCRLHEATTFALSSVEHFEDVAMSDGWTKENKCNPEELVELNGVLETNIVEMEEWRQEYGRYGYGRGRGRGRGRGNGVSQRGGGYGGSQGRGRGRGRGGGRGRGSTYFRQLMEDRPREQNQRRLCGGDCEKLCKRGASSWCNCCSCCGSRRRLEERETTNNLRGLQQLRIAAGVDLYMAAKEAAHYANQQLDNPLWAKHLTCLEYNGLYQEKAPEEVTDDEEKNPWGQWKGGFNIEVLIVDTATGKEVSSKAAPTDAPSMAPSNTPSLVPSVSPSKAPSMAPSDSPTLPE